MGKSVRILMFAVAAVAVVACFGDDPLLPDPGLTIVTNTTGDDLDPDGYTAVLEGPTDSTDYALAVNDSIYLPDIGEGGYGLTLVDVADNCTVTEPNPRQFQIFPGGGAITRFFVTCEAIQATSLRDGG